VKGCPCCVQLRSSLLKHAAAQQRQRLINVPMSTGSTTGKKEDVVQLPLELPSRLVEDLERAATQSGVSVDQLVATITSSYLDGQGPSSGTPPGGRSSSSRMESMDAIYVMGQSAHEPAWGTALHACAALRLQDRAHDLLWGGRPHA
jgi:hypothetical protein